MAYNKTVWVNDSTPAINATNLNNIENGIATANITGSITMYAGANAPDGWLICDGSAISRTDYADLFSIIGTTYGTGDGSTTFNIPNLKGRVPVGLDTSDTSFDTLGETGGEKTHQLTTNELPSHRHNGISWAGDFSTQAISLNAGSGQGYHLSFGSTIIPDQAYNIQTGYTGQNQAHNILQPYVVMNYIIRY